MVDEKKVQMSSKATLKSSPFGTEKSRTSTKQLNETDNRTAQKIGSLGFLRYIPEPLIAHKTVLRKNLAQRPHLQRSNQSIWAILTIKGSSNDPRLTQIRFNLQLQRKLNKTRRRNPNFKFQLNFWHFLGNQTTY